MGNDDARLALAGIEKSGEGYSEATIYTFHEHYCLIWCDEECNCDPDIRVEPDDGPAFYVGRQGERLHDHRH